MSGFDLQWAIEKVFVAALNVTLPLSVLDPPAIGDAASRIQINIVSDR